MKRINIMTSCTDHIAQYIMPQLASIHLNMLSYDIHFYLFHYRISEEKITLLKEYAKLLDNITFHEVLINNVSDLEVLAEYGGGFPSEAYIYMHCHDQLPQDMERIMYIDAGDVIIHGDVSDYYFDDFEDNSFIVQLEEFAEPCDGGVRLLDESDLYNPKNLSILRGTYVNSGCIVLNLEKLRKIGSGLMEHYRCVIQKILNSGITTIKNVDDYWWLGDQGVLGAAFVGDMKFFGFREVIRDTMHTLPLTDETAHLLNMYIPYNYGQWASRREDSRRYIPIILHYSNPFPKPWIHRFTEEDLEGQAEEIMLRLGRKYMPLEPENIPMHYIWWEYAALTPLATDDKRVRGLNPESRDKNVGAINPLQFMAEHSLAYEDFLGASEYIEKGLALATVASDSFNILWQLKVRVCLENKNNARRYQEALDVINEFLQTMPTSYMTAYMLHYKGYCHQQTEDFNNALTAYMKSNTVLDAIEQGIIPHADGTVFLANPTIPPLANALQYYGKYYAHLEENADAERRVIRSRAPISTSCNAKRIAECFIKLENFDEAVVWSGRIAVLNKQDVIYYFSLINEIGRLDMVLQLYEIISKASEECFAAFDDVISSHPRPELIYLYLAENLSAKGDEAAQEYYKRVKERL